MEYLTQKILLRLPITNDKNLHCDHLQANKFNQVTYPPHLPNPMKFLFC